MKIMIDRSLKLAENIKQAYYQDNTTAYGDINNITENNS